MTAEVTTLVIGGTGRVGRAVLRELAALGHDALPAGRRAEVPIDHDRPDSYGPALAGRRRLFVAVPDRPDSAQVERRLFEEAAAAGVERVVKLSAASAGWDPPRSFGVAHAEAEQALRAGPMAWTVLRPTVFQETIGLFCDDAAKGRMIVPRCKAPVAFVAVDDVAAVAARALTTDELAEATLTVTGPAGLTFDEVAAQVGRVVGRTVRHRSMPRALARRVLPRVAGMSPWLAGEIVDLFAGLDAGLQRTPSDVVERVLGRPATPLGVGIETIVGGGS